MAKGRAWVKPSATISLFRASAVEQQNACFLRNGPGLRRRSIIGIRGRQPLLDQGNPGATNLNRFAVNRSCERQIIARWRHFDMLSATREQRTNQTGQNDQSEEDSQMMMAY